MSTAPSALSIVIPAFDEEQRIGNALPQLLDVVDAGTTEIIVVDDGSGDHTAAVARECLEALPHHDVVRLPVNAGKGAAIRVGVSRARGEAIVFMDADMATDPSDLAPLVAALDRHHLAIGSRAHEDSTVDRASSARALMGRTFNLMARAAGGVPHHDTQCGFKAFRGPVAKLLFHMSRLNGFAFDVEVLMLAAKLGLSVAEVPVQWTAVPGSHVRPLRDPLPMVADVVKSRARWRNGRPVAAAVALGVDPGEAREAVAHLRRHLRRTDPVVTHEGGAVALLPCVDRSGAGRVARRLSRSLPEWKIGLTELPTATLLPPVSGLISAAVAAPDAHPAALVA